MFSYQCDHAISVLFLLGFSCATGVFGLRLVSLDVPTAVIQGDSVWLNCTLDLEMDELYSVKWYKNDVEFYRFVPRDRPLGQKFQVSGVNVDMSKSRQGKVFLSTTDLNTEGLYKCEASAESPTFQTVAGEQEIKVYVLPQEGPQIQGSQPRYEAGDIVNFTCRSSPSKPAAILKWYINGSEATRDLLISYPATSDHNGLQATSLGLTFRVTHEDAITLRCTAVVLQINSMTSEELIVGGKKAETSSLTVAPARDGPTITGGHHRYRVGDTLDVNCTSSRSNPAPELRWYLNDEHVSSENVITYPIKRYPDGTERSSLGLRFGVKQRHFDENDGMRLKCTATHSKVINMQSEEKTVGGNQRSSDFHVAENIGKVTSRNGCQLFQLSVLCVALTLAMFPFL